MQIGSSCQGGDRFDRVEKEMMVDGEEEDCCVFRHCDFAVMEISALVAVLYDLLAIAGTSSQPANLENWLMERQVHHAK